MTSEEKKLLQAKHRLEEAQARDRVKERKARTRRLIQEGAVLEKVLPEVQAVVRRIDDLGRVVIPKEIRRTMRIREGDPMLKTLYPCERFCAAMQEIGRKVT